MKKMFIALLMFSSLSILDIKASDSKAIRQRLAQLETRLMDAKKNGNDRVTSRVLLRLGQLNFHLKDYVAATLYINELLALSNPNLRDKVEAERLKKLIEKQ